MMVKIDEFKKELKKVIFHENYIVEEITEDEDGFNGYCVEIYQEEDNHLWLLNVEKLGLERTLCKPYFEPNYRLVYIFVEKTEHSSDYVMIDFFYADEIE